MLFISEKEFFIFIEFYPPKTQFLFSLNFEFSLQNEAGFVCVFLWCLPEISSHITINIRRGQHPIVKIEQKKKLSFRGVNLNKNKKFFFRDEYYCNICDITSV